ncbi:MAG: biopolymer transporter ExbD [Ignavibacteria bacterium]|nr:biopolymer transporter ExbD [Ignavibacteria bacterium]MCA0388168.1 biopolymer transporter ExbD [Bacteroidota bacterium]
MRFKRRNKPLAEFSFSSLTDVVMLLLIFFMITSQFVVQSGVKVKLPGSKNTEQVIPSDYVVTITKEGTYYVGETVVAEPELEIKLKALRESNEEANLIIASDKDVAIEKVVKVIDAAKGSGFDKFTLQTEKTTEQEKK